MNNNIFKAITALLFLLSISFPAYAIDDNRPHGITSSGSGTVVTVNSNTFDITGGTQAGNNLFHSFDRFNVHSGETANFNDGGIANTIGRVTGSDYSWINGTISSHAENLYLMNPRGIMFGEHATLDIAGSFHVTTADYLRLGDGVEKFYASIDEESILSASPPEAFGFLDEFIEPITFDHGQLTVSPGKTFSAIGGAITLNGTRISAPSGRINIAGVAGAGEVEPENTCLNMNTISEFAGVTINNEAELNVSYEGAAGKVFIRGGEILASNAEINSDSYGSDDAGRISLKGDSILFDNSYISSSTNGAGKGGDIDIEAGSLVMMNASNIRSNTNDFGDGGNIRLTGNTIQLIDSNIRTETSLEDDGGDAGVISIDAINEINLLNSVIETETEYSDGGDININAVNRLHLDNSSILTDINQFGGGSDNGNITIDPEYVILENSNIIANAYGGPGGNINIAADHYIVRQDSIVSASSNLNITRFSPEIISPEIISIDIPGSITPLSVNFPEEIEQNESDRPDKQGKSGKKALSLTSCKERTGEYKTSLTFTGRDATPEPLDDWRPFTRINLIDMEEKANPNRWGQTDLSELYDD